MDLKNQFIKCAGELGVAVGVVAERYRELASRGMRSRKKYITKLYWGLKSQSRFRLPKGRKGRGEKLSICGGLNLKGNDDFIQINL